MLRVSYLFRITKIVIFSQFSSASALTPNIPGFSACAVSIAAIQSLAGTMTSLVSLVSMLTSCTLNFFIPFPDYNTKITLFFGFIVLSALPFKLLVLLTVVVLLGFMGHRTTHRNLLAEESDFQLTIGFLHSLDVVLLCYGSLRFHITKIININDFPIGVAQPGQPENPPCHFKSVLGRVGWPIPPTSDGLSFFPSRLPGVVSRALHPTF